MSRPSLALLSLLALSATASFAADATLSTAERTELVDLLASSRDRIETIVAATPEALWTVKPAPDRWSVAEVIEHLVLSESMIRGFGLSALALPANEGWEAVAAAASSADLVARVGDRTQKFQAPEPLQPTGTLTRDAALRQFAAERAVTLEFVRSTTAPLKAHTAEGPPGLMNVVQWLTLVGAHTNRHAAQAQEALDLATAAAAATQP